MIVRTLTRTASWHRLLVLLVALGFAQTASANLAEMAEIEDWQGIEQELQAGGVDVNERQPDGMTALFWAVYFDNNAMVDTLLDAGADPNIENRYGLTPVMLAGENGNGALVAALLDAGADPNHATPDGDTPLMNAALGGSTEAVEALLEHGADVSARDDYLGQTALMYAAADNNAEIVRLLAEHGADVNAAGYELEFPGGTVGIGGVYPTGGLTPLYHAVRENSKEAVAALLELGADPDILNPRGISPLRVAAQNANLDIARMLIENGANINDGALVDIMEVDTEPKNRAAKNRTDDTSVQELMDMMFALGVDVDSTPEVAMPKPGSTFAGGDGTSGMTALYLASLAKSEHWVQRLLDEGADPNKVTLENGYTPVMSALHLTDDGRSVGAAGGTQPEPPTTEERLAIAEMLVEYGADLNIQDEGRGMTALHMAAGEGNDDLVRFLIDQGGDLALKDDSNRTPLDVAKGVPAVDNGERRGPPGMDQEPETHESTVALLTEAMEAAGVPIEEYEAPPQPEEDAEAAEESES